MKILLMEDDIILSEIILEHLESLNYEVSPAYNGIEAEDLAYAKKFDLLLLDVNVPHIDGFIFLKNLRESGNKTPAIFITSLDSTEDLKLGFDSGCDDYIKKPFDLSELETRINNIKRLYKIESKDRLMINKSLYFDKQNLILIRDDTKIAISKKEAEILEFFVLNKDKTIPINELANTLWSYEDSPSDATIRTYIKNLRKLIGSEYISNVRGVGYRFN